MPTPTTNPPMSPSADTDVPRPRHKFTRDDVARGVASGILPSGGYELIEGDILDKMGKNFPHILVTQRLLVWLQGVFGALYVVSQEPVVLNDASEPEPDAVVLTQPLVSYLTRGFLPVSDVRLLVEVSDSTLVYDQTTKARLYAQAGVTDYWVIDIPNRQLLVFRQPSADGYEQVTIFTQNESVTPLAALQASILVADLLPPILP